MRNVLLIVALMGLLLTWTLPVATVQANDDVESRYLLFGYSPDSETGHKGLSFEFGATSKRIKPKDRAWLIGGGLMFVGKGDGMDYDYDFPTPWPKDDACTDTVGQAGPEIGCFMKLGIELIERSNIFLTGIGGFSFTRERTVRHDSDVNATFNQGEESTSYGLYGYGITWILGEPKKGIVFSVDNDNRRGTTLSLGFPF